MNRLSKLFVILLLFVPSLAFAQYYSYSKRNGQVYYDGKIIHGADSHSFCDLGYGYGKDRNHVYRYGTILEYVDPSFLGLTEDFLPIIVRRMVVQMEGIIIVTDRDIMYQPLMYLIMERRFREQQVIVLLS